MSTSHITTHVLDTGSGKPAAGVAVTLDRLDGERWVRIAAGATDDDGRVEHRVPPVWTPARTGWASTPGPITPPPGPRVSLPEVTLTFAVSETQPHYHVPLLLSPFAYSTYRGS